MQRILVIDNVGLWISLNRHFAGEGQVRISDATTLKTGVRLAAVERPELIICTSGGADRSPSELAKLFAEASIELNKVLCVIDPGESSSFSVGSLIKTCTPDDFVEVVDGLIRDALAPVSQVSVDLLAHFERLGAEAGEETRGFVNVLEFDGTSLLIESTVAIRPLEAVELNFFLPRFEIAGTSHDRCQVSLRGEIRSCHDQEKLHYRFATTKIEDQSRDYLEKFVESKREKQENPR